MSSFNIAEALKMLELPGYLAQVEQTLATEIASDNPHINKPASRLLQAGSKRLRPSLLLAATCGQGNKIDEKAIAGCVAIELIHLASLVHDDIMDNATIRWNMPTIYAEEGVNQAILVGDYLFAKANLVAASVGPEVAKIVATTIIQLCGGQARELADTYNQERTIKSYTEAIRGKTGSLVAAACEVGGLLAGLDRSRTAALRNFGESFGMTFQIVDDVLDLVSSAELMGKPVGNDVAEGVYTMPVILGLQGAQRNKLLAYLKTAKNSEFGGTHLLIKGGYISQTIARASEYNQAASKNIASLTSSKLAGLPDAYLKWALKNMVLQKYQEII